MLNHLVAALLLLARNNENIPMGDINSVNHYEKVQKLVIPEQGAVDTNLLNG